MGMPFAERHRAGWLGFMYSMCEETQPALCNRRAFSLPPSLTQAAPGWRAPGNSVEAIEPPVWGHPNETPGTQRSTSEPRRRRDSGKPAGKSIRGEGYTDAGHGRQTH